MQNIHAYMEQNFKGADYKPDRINLHYVDVHHLDSTNH